MNITNVFDPRNTKSCPSLRMEYKYMHILFKISYTLHQRICVFKPRKVHILLNKYFATHQHYVILVFLFSEDTHLIQFSMLLKHFWTIQKLRHVVTLILPGFWTDPSRGLSWKKRFTWKFRVEAFSFIVKVSKRFWTKQNKCLWRWGKSYSPNVGLEPTTLRLRVSCSTDWASRADVFKEGIFLNESENIMQCGGIDGYKPG